MYAKSVKNEVFDKKNTQKYIDDFLKPNSVHFAVTVFGSSYTPESNVSTKNVKEVQIVPSDIGQKLVEMRESLSLICKNLEGLEINIESSINELVEKSAHKPLISE